VQFYASGTTTPITVYTAPDLLTVLLQPVVSDASGVFPLAFSAGGAIKAVVTKSDGSAFYTVDPVLRVPISASGASDITFSPTGPLPFTNVQAAIEGAAATAVTGFNAFGLGISGNTTLLANIDDIATASGVYRWDGASTGTFPTGITAATTGMVTIDRQTAANAMMIMRPAGVQRVYVRILGASVWQAWREIITALDGAARGALIRRGASNWEFVALGTSGQVLTSDGTDAAWATPGTYSIGSVVTLTGATTNLSTAIPSTANKIFIGFRNMSTNGTNVPLIQVGAGAFLTTGYDGTAYMGTVGGTNVTTGIPLYSPVAAANSFDGTYVMTRQASDYWFLQGITTRPASNFNVTVQGNIQVTGGINRVRLSGNGDSFDAGSGYISWE
jgi:hypothetical protein